LTYFWLTHHVAAFAAFSLPLQLIQFLSSSITTWLLFRCICSQQYAFLIASFQVLCCSYFAVLTAIYVLLFFCICRKNSRCSIACIFAAFAGFFIASESSEIICYLLDISNSPCRCYYAVYQCPGVIAVSLLFRCYISE